MRTGLLPVGKYATELHHPHVSMSCLQIYHHMSLPEVVMCSTCSQTAASSLCCCSYPPTPLCMDCLPPHAQTDGVHFSLPPSSAGQLSSEEVWTQAREHFFRIRTAEVWLNSNFEEVSRCEEAIRTAGAEAVHRITAATEAHLAALSLLKSALTTLIASASLELTGHLLDTEYRPTSQIAHTMWRFGNSSDPASLDVFKWKVSVQQDELDVRVNASFWTTCPELDELAKKRPFSLEDPFPDVTVIGTSKSLEDGYEGKKETEAQVVFVKEQFMRFYDCIQAQWRPKIQFNRAVLADETSSYCTLENSSVLCTGGGKDTGPWDTAYHLSQTGWVRELNRMLKPRRRHAVIRCGEFVFVFGGWSETRERSCEKLNVGSTVALDNKEWTHVSDMLFERSSFNPCLHSRLVYLCGGAGCVNAEVFNPVEELHFLVPVVLPDQSETFSIVKDGCLTVISKEYVSRWPVEKRLLSNFSKHTNVWGSMTPTHTGNFVYLPYILPDKAFVEQFDLNTMEIAHSYLPE